ncbi:MAG: hypothetical protein Kow00121_24380 [Elainellaceae cyanobacterium]
MTFRTIVEDHFHTEEICPATLNAQLAKIPLEDLQRYRLFRGHLGFSNLPELLPEKNIIDVTVLREPIARVISHYDYIRRMPGDPHYQAVKDMTLEEFAQKLTAGKVGKNIQTYHVAKTMRFSLDNLSPAEILDVAKESLDRFAFVGLVERFQDSLFLLSYIFGWKPIINSRKENAAKSKKSLDEIPSSTIDIIRENTLLDAELYEYAREIFERRFAEMTQNLVEHYAAPIGLELSPADAPTQDQYARLLDYHYQQRFVQSESTASTSYVYDFCLPLRGSGWQRRECPGTKEQHLTYRWTGPGTVSTLDLPVKVDIDADFLMEFRLICPQVTPPDILNSLEVKVNGQPIAIDILHSDQGTRFFQGVVPRGLLNPDRPFTECTFTVNRVRPLNESNPLSTDNRPVGLAFNFVQMFPTKLKRQRSALIPFFDNPAWRATVEFLQKHVGVDETVIAPLIFRVELENAVQDYPTFLEQKGLNWVVIHKGRVEHMGTVLWQLALRGLAPVFANDVFVIFSTHKLPKLSYTSAHVKPMYVDRVKQPAKDLIKQLYRRVKAQQLQVSK